MKKYKVLVLILAIALLPAAAHAQDNPQVSLAGGYTISLPDGWEQAEKEGVYTFSQGDLSISLTLPDVLASRVDLNADMDAAGVLVEVYAAMSEQTLDSETDIQTRMSSERAMATHEFQTGDGDGRGISVVLEVTPGQFALMEFQAPADGYEAALPDAFQIMESLQMRETSVGFIHTPCQVHAARNSVDLRVGPGTNRGVYTSMNSGPYYDVLGKKTLSDGSLWWRLDTDTGDANELWVADVDVETSGGCDLVADVDAPPLILAPPPPPPASSENPDSAPAAADPSKIPANGNWYFSVPTDFTVTCGEGIEGTGHNPDLGGSFTAQITASPDGTLVILTDPSGTTMFYGSDGHYQWATTVNGDTAFWHLYVSSPTQMSSSIWIPIGGTCSATIPVSVQYLG
jgi:hypothetical protein